MKISALSSLQQRIVSGCVLGPVMLALIFLGGWFFAALLIFTFIISFGEFSALAKRLPRPWLWIAAGVTYLAVGCLSFAWLRQGQADGLWLVLFLVFGIWASDIGAYATGRMIGGAKMAPTISPNKTWAGFWGSICWTGSALTLMALIFSRIGADVSLEHKPLWQILLAGAALGVIGQAGDLSISMLKRRAGVKDTGHIIPGHGGLLDRIDSLLLAAPVFTVMILLWP